MQYQNLQSSDCAYILVVLTPFVSVFLRYFLLISDINNTHSKKDSVSNHVIIIYFHTY
jgi:hypothetical protein